MGRLLMLLRETEDADAILCCPGYMPAFEILMSFIQIFLRKSVFNTPDVAADPLVMQRKPACGLGTVLQWKEYFVKTGFCLLLIDL